MMLYRAAFNMLVHSTTSKQTLFWGILTHTKSVLILQGQQHLGSGRIMRGSEDGREEKLLSEQTAVLRSKTQKQTLSVEHSEFGGGNNLVGKPQQVSLMSWYMSNKMFHYICWGIGKKTKVKQRNMQSGACRMDGKGRLAASISDTKGREEAAAFNALRTRTGCRFGYMEAKKSYSFRKLPNHNCVAKDLVSSGTRWEQGVSLAIPNEQHWDQE